jgi:zona occludens toxin
MSITGYTGVPGAGKSYALMEQVVIPGVLAGRRVVTNIAGVDPDKVRAFCEAKSGPGSSIGTVVLFEGKRATEPAFFPTEEISDENTFIKGGDLLVFDEWRLTWPQRGKLPSDDLEPFLRWSRHLVDAKGVACDIAIGTQLISDVHQGFRGLIERSYKFRKLKAVGLSKAFAWDAYEGHLQPKGAAYLTGNGTYKPEVFALYKSYASDSDGQELQTDKRTSIFTRGLYVIVAGVVLMLGLGGYGVYRFFAPPKVAPAAVAPIGGNAPGQPAPAAPPVSRFRIVGHILGDDGVRVIVADDKGALRVLKPQQFTFDGERPVSGFVDGQPVQSEDRITVTAAPVALPGFGS